MRERAPNTRLEVPLVQSYGRSTFTSSTCGIYLSFYKTNLWRVYFICISQCTSLNRRETVSWYWRVSSFCISQCTSIAQLHLLLTAIPKKLDTCHVLPLIFDCRYTRLVSNIYQRDATWGRTECRCCHQRRSTIWIQTGSGRRASHPVLALYLCSSTQKAVIIRWVLIILQPGKVVSDRLQL